MEVKPFRWEKGAAAFAAFLMAACLLAVPVSATDRADEARHFMEGLADRAVQSLTTGDISRDERVHRFRQIFNESFSIDAIGKWVLGRYWRRATPTEQSEYLKLFEDYIVVSYVDRFAAYAGEKLNVTKVLAQSDESITVFSEIVMSESDKTPVRVDWRIDAGDHQLKIIDLAVEGVSMSNSLRSDFGSIIRRDGSIAGLLAALREKTATLNTTD